MSDALAIFEDRLPEIERLARFNFRHLDPDAREEAIQNAVVLAYLSWTRLAEVGKTGEDCFKTVVWWACKHTHRGRQGGGCGKRKAKCVMDYARRRKGNVAIEGGIDLSYFVGRTATIPDAVAFRLDMPAFLATLTPRDREIAHDLASGMGTSEVARKRGVTPAAISQFRTRFRKKYDEFHAAI
jgi:hypothetical protein